MKKEEIRFINGPMGWGWVSLSMLRILVNAIMWQSGRLDRTLPEIWMDYLALSKNLMGPGADPCLPWWDGESDAMIEGCNPWCTCNNIHCQWDDVLVPGGWALDCLRVARAGVCDVWSGTGSGEKF